MQRTQELLVVPKNNISNDVGALGQFMYALQQKYGTAESVEKNAVWVTFPFLEVVSCGITSLAIAFAKKFEIAIRHDHDVHEIGEYLDRVLNAGLILKYATVNDAVEDFDQKVVKKVKQRIEEKKMASFAGVVEDIAYSFFADIYAETKKIWEKMIQPEIHSIKKVLAHAYQKNGMDLLGASSYLSDVIRTSRVFDIQLQLSKNLNEKNVEIKDETLRFENGRSTVFRLRGQIKKLLQVIDVLIRLPVNYGKLAEFGFIESGRVRENISGVVVYSGVADKWIATQVQRILAQLPDGECVNDREIVLANSAKRKSEKEIAKEMLVRMKKRGMKTCPTDGQIIEELVRETQPRKKVLSINSSDRVARGLDVFYVTEYDPNFLNKDVAQRFLEHYHGNRKKEEDQQIYQYIAENHPKLLLEQRGARFCLRKNLLNKEQIAEMIIAHKGNPERKAWADQLLAECISNEEYWKHKEIFIKKKIHKFDPESALNNIVYLSTEFVDTHIATTKILLNGDLEDYWLGYDKFGYLFQKMSKQKLDELMDMHDPDEFNLGLLVSMWLIEFINPNKRTGRHSQSKKDLQRMIEVIDNPWWIIEQVLGYALCRRADTVAAVLEKEKGAKEDCPDYNEPWGKGPERSILQSLGREFPELHVGTVEEVVQRYPEREIAEKFLNKKQQKEYSNFRML